MTLSRRDFFRSSAALAATAAVSSAATLHAEEEATPAPTAVFLAVTPPTEIIALNHMGYGPRPGDSERVQQMGLNPYIEEQLSPEAIDDSACDARLSAARLRIEYNTNSDGTPRDPTRPYKRAAEPLQTLGQTIGELWPRAKGLAPYQDWQERQRSADEVRIATWVRAVYSRRQLLEVLVDFWHNHFNVSRNTAGEIAATFALYDRIFRTHALGKFRTMLEETAKSVAMMYYLNNINNKQAGGEGPNENYARELFELHTLGSDNYYRFYDDRSQIGLTAYGGKQYVRGYIDDDVYEAAGCLTGWSIGNGRDGRPDDGQFHFLNSWHDNGEKIILSADGRKTIDRNGGETDGYKLLDMLANHPGTAQYVCTKLCRRLIGDSPPANVVSAAVAKWMETVDASDQLKQVLRVILTSDEFKRSWGQKIKRPFEFIVSYLRATNAELPIDTSDSSYWSSLLWSYGAAGQRLFEWPTPTGHPDLAWYWLSANGLLRRWNLPYDLSQSWGGNITIDIVGQSDLNATCTQIVDFWIGRLFGYQIERTTRQALIDFLTGPGDANKKPIPFPGEPNTLDPIKDRVIAMVQLMAMSPDFQVK